MVMSNAYQLSTQYTAATWNESWTPYYARHIPRRLMAEAMLDAIAKATSVPVTYTISGGLPAVTSAMKLPDTLEVRNNVYGRFLDEFGRGNRDDQARSNDSSIAQALVADERRHRRRQSHAQDHREFDGREDAGIDDRSRTSSPTSSISTRCPAIRRRPRRQQAVAYLKSGTLQNKTEDLQWVLLNSVEFLFN